MEKGLFQCKNSPEHNSVPVILEQTSNNNVLFISPFRSSIIGEKLESVLIQVVLLWVYWVWLSWKITGHQLNSQLRARLGSLVLLSPYNMHANDSFFATNDTLNHCSSVMLASKLAWSPHKQVGISTWYTVCSWLILVKSICKNNVVQCRWKSLSSIFFSWSHTATRAAAKAAHKAHKVTQVLILKQKVYYSRIALSMFPSLSLSSYISFLFWSS